MKRTVCLLFTLCLMVLPVQADEPCIINLEPEKVYRWLVENQARIDDTLNLGLDLGAALSMHFYGLGAAIRIIVSKYGLNLVLHEIIAWLGHMVEKGESIQLFCDDVEKFDDPNTRADESQAFFRWQGVLPYPPVAYEDAY